MAGSEMFRRKTPLPEPVPTKKWFYTDKCRCCGGTGYQVPVNLKGWFVDYNYQDGHEVSGPMTKEEAIKTCLEHRDPSSSWTLIGSDGQIYTLPDVSPRQ